MDNPTKEQLRDFEDHRVWKYLKEWIEKRMEDAKNSLLQAKDIEEVKKLQVQYETYKSILNKVKRP